MKCFILYGECFNDDANRTLKWVEEISLDRLVVEAVKTKNELDKVAKNALYEQIQILRKSLNATFSNDRPAYPSHLFVKVPKFKAGLRKEEITQEMRDEREKAIAHNASISQEYYDKDAEFTNNIEKIIRHRLNLDYDFDLKFSLENRSWSIEEKEMI